MPKTVRIVLDTNVLVSALFYDGKPGVVLDCCLDDKKSVGVISPNLLYELGTVISRPQWGLSADQVKGIVQFIRQRFFVRNITYIPQIVTDDPADNIVLATALVGKADFIVTGDRHLLILQQYKRTKIVTPDQFLLLILR